jgi:hypothetical protein
MLAMDPGQMIRLRQQELHEAAEHERLLALVPRAPGGLRHGLASACYRLADWLDQEWYGRPAESGREDWARSTLGA